MLLLFFNGFVNASGVNFTLNRMSSLEVGMFGIRADRGFHLHSIVDFLLSTLICFSCTEYVQLFFRFVYSLFAGQWKVH